MLSRASNNLQVDLHSFAASAKLEDGISTCLRILAHLGENIPVNITEDTYRAEVTEVKRLLHGKTKEDLLSLPVMTDKKKMVSG